MTFTSSLLPLPIYSTGYPMKRRSSFYFDSIWRFTIAFNRSRNISFDIFDVSRINRESLFVFIDGFARLWNSYSPAWSCQRRHRIIDVTRETRCVYISIIFSDLEPWSVCSRKCHDLVLTIVFFFLENFKLLSWDRFVKGSRVKANESEKSKIDRIDRSCESQENQKHKT